jgi:hypothetical protein
MPLHFTFTVHSIYLCSFIYLFIIYLFIIVFFSKHSVGPGKEGNKNIGLMFLNEVILGEEHHILRDDSSLCKAPNGCHSVIAKGRVEPDPKQEVQM